MMEAEKVGDVHVKQAMLFRYPLNYYFFFFCKNNQ